MLLSSQDHLIMADLIIKNFDPKYKQAFKELNKAWIDKYFVMESEDYKSLDHPEESIINKGGYIFVALNGDQVIGVCALVKMDDADYDYELSKMAVDPSAHGHGIGQKLAEVVIQKAKSLGSRNLFLESNTVLVPAINLYRKLGFKEVLDRPSPYERSNIQMVLKFD